MSRAQTSPDRAKLTTKPHLPFPRHGRTRFIEIDPHRCDACWACIEACPSQVLGMVIFLGHRHTHIDHAEACKGCKTCVRACPNGAITYIYTPVPRSERCPRGNETHIPRP